MDKVIESNANEKEIEAGWIETIETLLLKSGQRKNLEKGSKGRWGRVQKMA